MTPTLTLVRDNMSGTIERYAEVMGRTLPDTLKRAFRGITRRVVNITPPAHSVAGQDNMATTGAAAYRFGRKKIRRQMEHAMAPVRLKGRRLITHVYGHKLATPVSVRTRERHPDVAAEYRRLRRFSETDLRAKSRLPSQRKIWVDQRKFNALLKAKERNVGKLASGWAAAAAAIDIPVQNWISRHGRSRGRVKFALNSSAMRITAAAMVPSGVAPNVRVEIERRIAFAITYQRGAMQREIDYFAIKKAQELAIKTRNFTPLLPEGMQGG